MKFRSLIYQPEVKTLAGNFIALSVLKAVSFFFPLITLPYLSRVIGVERFGDLAFAAAIMIFVETITDWGFNYTATRDVAQNRDDLSRVSHIFSEVIFAKLFLTIVCFVGLYAVATFIPTLRANRLLLLLTFAYIPGHILFPEWLFQAFERMKYITVLNVLSKTVFTVLIFLVIKTQQDYIYQPVLIACGYIVSGTIAMYMIRHTFRVNIVIPSVRDIIRRLQGSTNMFICLLLPNLYTNFSTVILKTCCGSAATGIFSEGQRFQQIIDQLTQVLSRTFFPFLARHKEKHYMYVRISGVISVVACFTLFFGADLFVRLFYTSEFASVVPVIRIFAITPFFLFLMNTYGTNYLVVIGKENILRNIIIFCSFLGLVLTWIIIPKYSFLGAAVSITVVWGIRGVLTYLFARKEK